MKSFSDIKIVTLGFECSCHVASSEHLKYKLVAFMGIKYCKLNFFMFIEDDLSYFGSACF